MPVENLLLVLLDSNQISPNFFNCPSQSDGVGKEGTVPESLLKQARKTGSPAEPVKQVGARLCETLGECL
uniref:Uncharacterized protein n=1 Tax=Amphimedon queenslandica TaxID=400682 RepID=A0A1X7U8E2_AMPQE